MFSATTTIAHQGFLIEIEYLQHTATYFWQANNGTVKLDNSKNPGCELEQEAIEEARKFIDWYLSSQDDN